jgi:thiamine biosynthesis protein ThiS
MIARISYNSECVIVIEVNGERREVPGGLTVLGLLEQLGVDPARVAVELDRLIVRKAAWPDTPVREGARVEVVQFVGGG